MEYKEKLMGWWPIKDSKHPGIDWSAQKKDPEDTLWNGDGPADIMDKAINDIIEEYKKAFDRRPAKEELRAVFNFCISIYEDFRLKTTNEE